MAEVGERGVAVMQAGSGGDAPRPVERHDLPPVAPFPPFYKTVDGRAILCVPIHTEAALIALREAIKSNKPLEFPIGLQTAKRHAKDLVAFIYNHS